MSTSSKNSNPLYGKYYLRFDNNLLVDIREEKWAVEVLRYIYDVEEYDELDIPEEHDVETELRVVCISQRCRKRFSENRVTRVSPVKGKSMYLMVRNFRLAALGVLYILHFRYVSTS